MKTIALVLMIASTMVLTPAFAQQGGFKGPGPNVVTVEDAKKMRDDSRVSLRGYIIQHLGGDRYQFRDATDTVRVEIDDNLWKGQTISPEDFVEIYGEVDKDWNSVEIEVKRLSKISS